MTDKHEFAKDKYDLISNHNNDKNKARRYASTRVAADIGKRMELKQARES